MANSIYSRSNGVTPSPQALSRNTEGFLLLKSGIAKCENRVPPIELWLNEPYYVVNKQDA